MAEVVQRTIAANTPAIITSAGVALASNEKRIAWNIQNLGQSPLFVLLGAGASTSVFHKVLKGATANDDGTGGEFGQGNGVVYTGVITVAGTNPRFVILEQAP